jgi:hypothetical protein
MNSLPLTSKIRDGKRYSQNTEQSQRREHGCRSGADWIRVETEPSSSNQ